MNKTINYLSLFSGIGGFELGLQQAGFKFNWVGFSEIDKYAKQTYQKHFPKAEDLGDVTEIDVSGLPRINLITFGFPCQDLSIAGKRAGLAGKRSGLFDEAIRIIRGTKPDYFIFENVKGLFSSNNGRDFEYVLRTIADIGYDGQWQLLNTRWFLPQNRERIYFVGYSRNGSRPKVFPIGEANGIYTENKPTVQCLDKNYHKGWLDHGQRTMIQYGKGSQDTKLSPLDGDSQTKISLKQIGNIDKKGHNSIWGRVYDPKGDAVSINSGGRGMGAKTGLYEVQPLKFLGRNQKNYDNDVMLTPDSCNTTGVKKDSTIRRLTPTECARLQGFSDNWHEGVSDTQAYKCYGNAVSVPVVKAVAERLINA